MQKKIVIITTGQPSTNPRLQKEVAALSADGRYNVTVLYSYWTDWADAFDAVFFRRYPGVTFIRVGGHPEEAKATYFLSRAAYKTARLLARLYPKNNFLGRCILSRTAYQLAIKARALKADLYIAHNLGAIPAAVQAAKKHGAKCGADMEDYYSGQWTAGSDKEAVAKAIEQTFLPRLDGYTTASPLIADAYKALAPEVRNTLLLNVFPKLFAAHQPCPYKGQLKLFWTSQTVGLNRGLEEVIAAMASLKTADISLTIVGAYDPETKQRFLSLATGAGLAASQLSFLSPLPLEELFMMAAQHHIGLAIETEPTTNRQICLTNKLFTYLLSGLATVANDTPAQQQFFDTYPGIGRCYNAADKSALHNLFRQYLANPERLIDHQHAALHLAVRELNWENESKKFLAHVDNLLQ